MTLNVVIGPPYSGKSSFVEASAPVGVPRFDFDLITGVVAAGEYPSWDTPIEVVDTVLAMRRGLIGWVLDPETQVNELWLVAERPPDDLISKLAGAGGVFHRLDPGKEECIARAQRAGAPDQVLQRIESWYDNPPVLPGEEKGGGRLMKLKDLRVQLKEPEDGKSEDSGELVAYASVFDNIDSYGDVIRKGAFKETLDEWAKSGNQIPLLYGHDFRDPFANIGAVTEAVEDDHGLKITAKLDLDNDKAAQVFRLLKEKRLNQMSFAFDVVEGGELKIDDNWCFEIRKVRLHEVSVVPIGANQETEVLDVKSGERLSDIATLSKLLVKIAELVEKLNATGDPPEPPEGDFNPVDDSAGFSHAATSGTKAGVLNALGARIMILEKENY